MYKLFLSLDFIEPFVRVDIIVLLHVLAMKFARTLTRATSKVRDQEI